MDLALSLGRRGLGQVWPWPSVGCVLVRDDGRIVGRGTSDQVTCRHAERVALDQAGASARGATAYVTLEPCAHQGTTPPCCDALIDAGVARVVTPLEDPNPLVAGQGLARMRAAGIAVEVGLGAEVARADNGGFLKVQAQGLPFVTLKLATSFDGRIATATGESQWITGPGARRLVHGLRASHDAVLVGAGTVRADDPALTVRGLGPVRQPVRVVASRRADFSGHGLTRDLPEAPLWLCHGKEASAEVLAKWQERGAETLLCPAARRQIDPTAMLEALATKGLTRVFCEGGGSLAASLLGAGLVDELIGFSAGLTLGAEGTPGIGAMGIDQLAEAPRFQLVESRRVGADLMHRWRRPGAFGAG